MFNELQTGNLAPERYYEPTANELRVDTSTPKVDASGTPTLVKPLSAQLGAGQLKGSLGGGQLNGSLTPTSKPMNPIFRETILGYRC